VRDVGIASLDALYFVPAIAFPPRERPREKKKKERKGKESVRSMKHERIIDTTLPLFAITD
jgi:hypothetical protein